MEDTVFYRLGVIFGNGYPPYEVVDVAEDDVEDLTENSKK